MKIEPSKDWYEQSANIEGDSEIGAGVLPVSYQPEMVVIRKDWIYAAQSAIESGIESVMQELATHEVSLGRTTPKNKRAAESMEREIQKMRTAKNQLNDFTFNPKLRLTDEMIELINKERLRLRNEYDLSDFNQRKNFLAYLGQFTNNLLTQGEL